MDAELSICTVSFHSATWLALNHALVTRLNPGAEVLWWVAENTPGDAAERLDPATDRFRVVPGAPFEPRPYAAGSYHHAAGLARLIPRVATRFLLVLDPDFFVVRRNWIREVLEHMKSAQVAVFGAPWHPSRFRKLRYQPCAHCTFFDLERVDRDGLDFSPDYECGSNRAPKREARSLWSRADPLRLAKRRRIGTSRDTGWRLQQRWATDPTLRVECLQPSFRPRLFQRIGDVCFPEALRLVPGRPGYFVSQSFADAGISGLEETDCEEFFWRGAPFGFHVRCHPIRTKRPGALEGLVLRVRHVLDGI